MFHEKIHLLLFVCLFASILSEEVDKKLTESKSDNKTDQLWSICSDQDEGSPNVDEKKKLDQPKITTITHTIKKSSKEAEVLKMSFIRNVMNAIPDSLEAGLDDWLPQVPQFFSIPSFNEATGWAELESIARNLTSYANIIGDIVNQTMAYEPGIQQRFQRLRNRLYLILCKMREGFHITPVMKNNSSSDAHLATSPEEKSKWNRSVYLVLRDYIKLLNHLLQLLINLSSGYEETVDQETGHRLDSLSGNN